MQYNGILGGLMRLCGNMKLQSTVRRIFVKIAILSSDRSPRMPIFECIFLHLSAPFVPP